MDDAVELQAESNASGEALDLSDVYFPKDEIEETAELELIGEDSTSLEQHEKRCRLLDNFVIYDSNYGNKFMPLENMYEDDDCLVTVVGDTCAMEAEDEEEDDEEDTINFADTCIRVRLSALFCWQTEHKSNGERC